MLARVQENWAPVAKLRPLPPPSMDLGVRCWKDERGAKRIKWRFSPWVSCSSYDNMQNPADG